MLHACVPLYRTCTGKVGDGSQARWTRISTQSLSLFRQHGRRAPDNRPGNPGRPVKPHDARFRGNTTTGPRPRAHRPSHTLARQDFKKQKKKIKTSWYVRPGFQERVSKRAPGFQEDEVRIIRRDFSPCSATSFDSQLLALISLVLAE